MKNIKIGEYNVVSAFLKKKKKYTIITKLY